MMPESRSLQPVLTRGGTCHVNAIALACLAILLLGLLSACSSTEGSLAETSIDDSERETVQEVPPTALPQMETAPVSPSNPGIDLLAGFNPCEMLTQAEVESFFDGPMSTDAAPESIGPYRSCMFTSQVGGKMIIVQVTHETAAQFKADNEGSAAMLEMIPTPVAGLGDESVFFSGLLRVRVGDQVLQIVTWHNEEQQDQAFHMTQDIARLALPRMP
jgi:hypothetical protein